ncbi:hypothetical protein [Salmonella phage PHA46]
MDHFELLSNVTIFDSNGITLHYVQCNSFIRLCQPFILTRFVEAISSPRWGGRIKT